MLGPGTNNVAVVSTPRHRAWGWFAASTVAATLFGWTWWNGTRPEEAERCGLGYYALLGVLAIASGLLSLIAAGIAALAYRWLPAPRPGVKLAEIGLLALPFLATLVALALALH